MKTISDLAKDIKNIYEEVLILQKSIEKRDIDIDFQKINAIASKNPIKNHYISKLDEYTQKAYLIYLSKTINLTKNDKTKYSQILFISRLISSIDNPSFDTKEILLSSLSDEINIYEFVKCISDEVLDIFIVDNLILAYINGNVENEVLDYISEIISLFNIESEKFKELVKLAKSILIKDDDKIIEYSKLSDLNLFLCYTKNYYDVVALYSLEDSIKETNSKIILVNLEIKNKDDVINLDVFKSEHIIFKNCKFKNINGISSIEKIVEFHNCIFENCNVSKELIFIKKGSILKSSFIECEGVDVESNTFLINISKGKIEDVKFKSCKIKSNSERRSRDIIGIIRLSDGIIKNLYMDSCESYVIKSYGYSFVSGYSI